MNAVLTMLTNRARFESARAPGELNEMHRLFWVGVRYGISTLGPLSVSGAHFLAALIFLQVLSQNDFGLVAFLLIVVPFCLSMSGALLAASVAIALNRTSELSEAQVSTHLKMNLIFSGVALLGTGALMLVSNTPIVIAVLMALYGGVMTLRYFARSLAYLNDDAASPITADLMYAALLIGTLGTLWATGTLTLFTGAAAMLVAGAASIAAFGRDYLIRQFVRLGDGSILAYGPIWRDLTRWSMLGVVMTEMTGNAHAYLVTFLSGPQAFAILAVGALLTRPVSLVVSALPDMERPVMARAIAKRDIAGALRSVKEFRTAAGAVWVATLLLAGLLLLWFPTVVLKDGVALHDMAVVLGFWAAIQGVRAWRTPPSVLLQAAGELRGLAHASAKSCIASLIATLALLLAFGPIFSLGGVLIGDLVMTADIARLTRNWKRQYA